MALPSRDQSAYLALDAYLDRFTDADQRITTDTDGIFEEITRSGVQVLQHFLTWPGYIAATEVVTIASIVGPPVHNVVALLTALRARVVATSDEWYDIAKTAAALDNIDVMPLLTTIDGRAWMRLYGVAGPRVRTWIINSTDMRAHVWFDDTRSISMQDELAWATHIPHTDKYLLPVEVYIGELVAHNAAALGIEFERLTSAHLYCIAEDDLCRVLDIVCAFRAEFVG